MTARFVGLIAIIKRDLESKRIPQLKVPHHRLKLEKETNSQVTPRCVAVAEKWSDRSRKGLRAPACVGKTAWPGVAQTASRSLSGIAFSFHRCCHVDVGIDVDV